MAGKLVKKFFQNHPLFANSIVYGSLYVSAELSQQVITKKLMVEKGKEKPIDYAILGRYLVVGSLINSNYFFVWYRWLDNKYVGNSKKIVIKKVLLDQFVMTPPLYVIFFVTMNLMEGKENIWEECKAKFPKTFWISCLFWLPVQTINFLYLPNAARIVYMGACSFAWVNVLCYVKRKSYKIESTSN